MRNKTVFYLLLVGLLSVVLMLTACGNTTEANDGIRTIPHDLVSGSVNCVACHTGGLHPAPADHADLSVELCSEPVCHAPSGTPPTTTMPSEPNDGIWWTIPHDLELVSADCLLCHTGGPRPIPGPTLVDHTEFPVESCSKPGCHAASTTTLTEPNDGIWTIPHDLDLGGANCLLCHAGKPRPVPADHAGRTSETCTTCHAPSGGAPPPTTPNIPHTLEGRDDCLMCHEATIPADHSGYTNNTCLTCHEEG